MRYIDADNLVERLKVSPIFQDFGTDGYFIRDMVIDLVGCRPTADVVPKSEVEEIIGKFECFLCHVTGGRLSKYTYDLRTMETVATDCINETYNDGLGEGYKECAREIFEEIERFLYLHFRFCKEEIGNDDTECVKGRMELNTQIQNFIAELKKKYTEGK